MVIDFSRNRLTGKNPEKIADLLRLMALNLWRNNFIGDELRFYQYIFTFK
jgi:hypothetical protein